jgi:hypothetical protein
MAGKSLFAKVVVFCLIAGNLGAYYVFWPTNPSRSGSDSKRDDSPTRSADSFEPKQLTLGAAKKETTPAEVKPAALVVSEVMPPQPPPAETVTAALQLPDLPQLSAPPAIEPAVKLEPVPPPPKSRDDQQSKLESLKNALAPGSGPSPPTLPSAASSPLKLENSPWTFQMDFSEGRTLLKARLHQSAEFKVLCDKVEMKAPDGAVQTVGKVSVTGPGLTASCQRLTLPLTGEHMILEGQAELKIQDGAAGSTQPGWELKGEQLTVRPLGLSAGVTPPLRSTVNIVEGTPKSNPAPDPGPPPGLFPLLPAPPPPGR